MHFTSTRALQRTRAFLTTTSASAGAGQPAVRDPHTPARQQPASPCRALCVCLPISSESDAILGRQAEQQVEEEEAEDEYLEEEEKRSRGRTALLQEG